MALSRILKMRRIAGIAVFTALLATSPVALAEAITASHVERTSPGKVVIAWTGKDPVDVYVSDRPDASLAQATKVSAADRDGRHEADVAAGGRPYFTLRNTLSGETVHVAERLVPLEQGSNFRDVGGYQAAGGKHVRWGKIYRSGGTPMLTNADIRRVQGLVSEMVDLRSTEERSLAPTRVEGVNYSAVGYSMTRISSLTPTTTSTMGSSYRNFPAMLAPHLKIVFARLLANQGAVVYNCSAGQDRTGFATAMVLSALGVSRDEILKDYHLSTTYRRPEYEMPRFDAAAQAANPVAAFFANDQKDPAAAAPSPLFDTNRRAFLEVALDEVETKWGSVDKYLAREVGIGPVELARLRAIYLQ
jgi:protein-tyrosine phosphatase